MGMLRWKLRRELQRIGQQLRGIPEFFSEPAQRRRHDATRPEWLRPIDGEAPLTRKVALLLLYVYKRLWHRIWEHIRILMILTEKQKQEDSIGKLLVSAHIPADIQNHIFPPGGISRPDAAGRTGRSFLKTQNNNNTKLEAKTPLQEKQEFIMPDLHLSPVLSPTVASKLPKKEVMTPEDRNAALFVAAAEEGLLPPFTEAQLSLEQVIYSLWFVYLK